MEKTTEEIRKEKARAIQKRYRENHPEEIREKARKFYAKNKERISEQRKRKRQEKKNKACMCPCPCETEPAPEPTPEPEPEPATEPETTVFTIQDILDTMKSKFPPETKENTIITHYQGMKRLAPFLSDPENVVKSLRNPSLIENMKKEMKINTYKATITSILRMATLFDLKDQFDIEKYKTEFEISNIESRDFTKEKNKNLDLPTLSDFTKKVIAEHPTYGQYTALIKLYNELPLRNNFFNLKVLNQKQEGDFNVLMVPENENDKIVVFLNSGKTLKKHDLMKKGVQLSKSLSKYLRAYMAKHKITYDDFLFGTKNLSTFISKNNKLMGVDGGIDYIRKMKVKEIENEPAEVKNKWLKIMGHSYATQQHDYKTG